MNVELFPCSGGMAEGFRRAGLRFDMSFDWDDDACASYEKNLGHRPIQMDVRDLRRMLEAGWRPGPVGLLVADPPCTPWSRAGKREGLDDDRDMLRDTMAIALLLKPSTFLIANVPGLDDADHWKAVVQPVIYDAAGLAGYHVDYVSLNAADFGVPQTRVRPFWFAHRAGTSCIAWPAPTHYPPPVLMGLGFKPHVTCREALGHLSADELGRPVRLRYRGEGSSKKPRASELDAPAGVVTAREGSGDGCVLVAAPHARHPISESGAPSRTIKPNGGRASQAGSMLRLADPNRPPVALDEPFRTVTKATEYQTAIEWPWDRPSTTVTTRGAIPPPGHHDRSMLSQPDAVVLSEKAAAILQGFPDGWVFAGRTKRSRWSQLGMAMPPPLAHAVAKSIVSWARLHSIGLEAAA